MKVILDTNVWSRLVDARQVEAFRGWERSAERHADSTPVDASEALWTPNRDIRAESAWSELFIGNRTKGYPNQRGPRFDITMMRR